MGIQFGLDSVQILESIGQVSITGRPIAGFQNPLQGVQLSRALHQRTVGFVEVRAR